MSIVHIGIIGCGFMGSLYGRICLQLPAARVVAVIDVDDQKARSLAEEVGATAYAGDDFDTFFSKEPKMDAVLICTPEFAHVEPVLAALRAGKNILVEKPLATSLLDGERILQAHAQHDVISMIAYSLRFDPRYVAMWNAVQNKEVGDIIHMYARRNMSEAVIQRLSGRVEAPFWVGVHDIDMMRWLTGSNVKKVMSVASDKAMPKQWNLKTIYYALLTFEDGTIAALENAWSVSPMVARPQAFAFRLEGSLGQLEVRSHDSGLSVYTTDAIHEPDTVYMPNLHGQITGVYRNQIAYFVSCVRKGIQTMMPLTEGWNGVQAAAAIVQSAEEHREIIIE